MILCGRLGMPITAAPERLNHQLTATDPEAVTSRDVAKGAGTTLLARLGGVIEVVAQPLYVLMFGLTGYGLYAALWAAVNLVENIADLGMTSSLQRTVPQAKSEAEAVASLHAALLLGVGPCLAVAALVALNAEAVVPVFNAAPADAARLAHIIAVFVWTLPLWAFIEIATSALRARRVFGAEVRLRLFWEQVVRLIVAVGLWSAAFGTMALFYAHLASLSIICLLCVRLLAQHYDLRLLAARDGAGMVRPTLQAGLAVLPSNIVARLFGDAPTLILNAWLPGATGAAAGGLFAIVRKIASIVQILRTAFAYVLAPLASLASTGKRESVGDIYGFATRVSFAVSVPLGVVLAAGGPAVLSLFGSEAQVALAALVAFIAARIVEAIAGAALPIQQVIAGYKSQLVGSVAGLAVATAIVVGTMPHGGLTAMTVAVAAGVAVAALIPLWQLWRYDGLQPFAAPFAGAAVKALAVAGGGLAAALAIMTLPSPAQLPLLLFTLAASLWTSCRWALPHHDRAALGKMGRTLRLN